MEEPIIVEDSDNDTLQEWTVKNPDLMSSLKSSGNKPLFIPRPISISDAVINQTGSLSMRPNDADIDESGRENTITVDSTIKNKGARESKEDAKVGLKV